MQKPSREDVREAWEAMDAAMKIYVKARDEFDRLRRLRYPPAVPTEAELAEIDAMPDWITDADEIGKAMQPSK